MVEVAPNALLREIEDDLLRLVDELGSLAEPLAAEPGDLLAYPIRPRSVEVSLTTLGKPFPAAALTVAGAAVPGC